MSLSNLLTDHENKIRMTQNDYVITQLIPQIGVWDSTEIDVSCLAFYFLLNTKINPTQEDIKIRKLRFQ